MLRSALAQGTRAPRVVASSSSKPVAHLHTSAPLCVASDRRRKLRTAAQRQAAQRRDIAASEGRPHVILGHRPGDEAKWVNCDLAKVIITEKQILDAPKPKLADKEVTLAGFMNYGIGEKEKELLFEVLPDLTEEANHMANDGREPLGPEDQERAELHKTTMLATLVDLRNANADGIAYENRKRIVAAFSRPGQPGDTGLPEVQAAIMTMRIRNVWDHLSRNRKDTISRRSLRELVHQRAKILKYLRRLDRDRYDAVLGRLGLEPGSVEGELVV